MGWSQECACAGCQVNLFVIPLSCHRPLGQGGCPTLACAGDRARTSQDAVPAGPLLGGAAVGGGFPDQNLRSAAGCHHRRKSSDRSSLPMLMFMAVMEGALRYQEEREESKVPQQLGADPWEEPRPLPSQKLLFENKCPEGPFPHCLQNPNFWLKDLFQKARLILGLQVTVVNFS